MSKDIVNSTFRKHPYLFIFGYVVSMVGAGMIVSRFIRMIRGKA